MGKYKRYKNRIEMFLSSDKGKRVLNFCYSWGASIVIIGAMFKLLHFPYGNQILFVAMTTEALVFFISAFERPFNEYNWEEVFPVLKSKNPLDRPDFEHGENGGTVIIGSDAAGGKVTGGGNGFIGGGVIGGGGGVIGGPAYAGPTPEESAAIGLTAMGLNVSEEDQKNLANSIQKLSDAAEQISKVAELTDATQAYIEQISSVSQNLERFNAVTGSLSDVSDSIVSSCKAIAGTDSEDPEKQTAGYVHNIEKLNNNLTGLNQFYEVQLNGLRSQMDTIYNINAGLNRIREMYDNSVIDSTAFRNENERMAQLLGQLNQVYSRLLQAMTVQTSFAGSMPSYQQPPQQQPYQGQGYPQQPPYPAR
jgi:gliding motility-associated protein GldL